MQLLVEIVVMLRKVPHTAGHPEIAQRMVSRHMHLCRAAVIASWKHLTRALFPRALQHWPRVHSMSAVGCALLLSWSMIASASRACRSHDRGHRHVNIIVGRQVLSPEQSPPNIVQVVNL